MREKGRTFLKALCKLAFQALLVLIAIFVGLYLFADLIIFGGLSWS